MFETITVSTRMAAIVYSQSVSHSAVGGCRVSTISGVLFSVEKYPATDIMMYRQKTSRIERLMIFIRRYLTGFTSSWYTGSTLHWFVKANKMIPAPLKN